MESEVSFVGNIYWVLRHGTSIPNEKGLIVTSMEIGVLSEYQLAPDGIAQAQLAGELFVKQLKESNIGLDKVRICYSPFSRTTHTARVVAQVHNLPFDGPQCKVDKLVSPNLQFVHWSAVSKHVLSIPKLQISTFSSQNISKIKSIHGFFKYLIMHPKIKGSLPKYPPFLPKIKQISS